jgi:hypothetical protein
VVRKALHPTQGLNILPGGLVTQGLNAPSGEAAADVVRPVGTRERSRWTAGEAGHFPSMASTAKLRAIAAAGLGEAQAVQREVARMERLTSETAELPRRATTPEEVVAGLPLEQFDAERIKQLLREIQAGYDQKRQTQALGLARGHLASVMREMRSVPDDVRQEVEKRALAFWRVTRQTDYGKEPTVRYVAHKSLGPAPVLPLGKFPALRDLVG